MQFDGSFVNHFHFSFRMFFFPFSCAFATDINFRERFSATPMNFRFLYRKWFAVDNVFAIMIRQEPILKKENPLKLK